MERRLKLSSDFILLVWMVVLVVFVLGACSEDSDINPRTYPDYEVTEFDYRFLEDGEEQVEVIPLKNNFPKYNIASPDMVYMHQVASDTEEEF